MTTTANRLIAHTLTKASKYIRPLPSSTSSSTRPPSPDRDPTSAKQSTLETDFILYPQFFSASESEQLLRAALDKLDKSDSCLKRRRGGLSSAGNADGRGVDRLFSRDGEYGFQEGHYDSVIHHYRETLMSALPVSNLYPSLPSLMKRLYALLPSPPPSSASSSSFSNSKSSTPRSHLAAPSPTSSSSTPSPEEETSDQPLPPKRTSTHLLHLSPDGEILPHIDNLDASGSVIVGVSLGGERLLRLESGESTGDILASGKDGTAGEEGGGGGGWDVRLPNGSVYIQRDRIRYKYKHSILPYTHPDSVWDGERLIKAHRVSIMIRDAPSRQAQL